MRYKFLLNLDRFYSILATIQYFEFWNSGIMDQFVTFYKRVYTVSIISILSRALNTCYQQCGKQPVTLEGFSCRIIANSDSHRHVS